MTTQTKITHSHHPQLYMLIRILAWLHSKLRMWAWYQHYTCLISAATVWTQLISGLLWLCLKSPTNHYTVHDLVSSPFYKKMSALIGKCAFYLKVLILKCKINIWNILWDFYRQQWRTYRCRDNVQSRVRKPRFYLQMSSLYSPLPRTAHLVRSGWFQTKPLWAPPTQPINCESGSSHCVRNTVNFTSSLLVLL